MIITSGLSELKKANKAFVKVRLCQTLATSKKVPAFSSSLQALVQVSRYAADFKIILS